MRIPRGTLLEAWRSPGAAATASSKESCPGRAQSAPSTPRGSASSTRSGGQGPPSHRPGLQGGQGPHSRSGRAGCPALESSVLPDCPLGSFAAMKVSELQTEVLAEPGTASGHVEDTEPPRSLTRPVAGRCWRLRSPRWSLPVSVHQGIWGMRRCRLQCRSGSLLWSHRSVGKWACHDLGRPWGHF